MERISTVPKGAAFGRYVRSLLVAGGDLVGAHAYALGQGWHRDTPAVLEALKAAVEQVDSAVGIGALTRPVSMDFAEFLRPLTLIGRMQGLRRTPFNTRMVSATQGATAAWVGEGLPKPATSLSLSEAATLVWNKVAALSVHTVELARSQAQGVDLILASDVARALAAAADSAFIDPSNAGIAGVRPTSVTHGASSFAASGTDVASIDADLRKLLSVLTDAHLDLTFAHWVMAPATAVYLSTLRGDGGAPAYPAVTAKGGTLLGLPVLTTNAAADLGSPAESVIALVAADEVMLADDGDARIEVSEQAALQLDDAPSEGAQQLVSMWQNGLVCLRAERLVNWQLRRAAGAAVLTGVSY